MVVIIDYGMGNVASVQKALNFLNIKSVITADHQQIKDATSIILPGVGSFYQGMKNLNERGLVDLLTEQVIVEKKKFLGICLGMQLIMEKGFEPIESNGLGWIEGKVIKFDLVDLAIPHMGWNEVKVINNQFYKEPFSNDYYYIHSYHVVPKYEKDIAATSTYGFNFVSSIQRDNIFTTQFHPEKSQKAGLTLLNNFFKENA